MWDDCEEGWSRVSSELRNEPSISVPPELGGKPLDAVVRALFGLSWGQARSRITTGKVSVDGVPRTRQETRVRGGSVVAIRMSAPNPRVAQSRLSDDAVVYWDTHVVVVDKPAGISTVPFDGAGGSDEEEEEQGTLDARVRDWLARRIPGRGRPPLGVVHRLDKETSGLIVFTRTWLAKQSLSSQFRAHQAQRRYLAIAHGQVRAGTIRSHLIVDRGDGLRGSLEAQPGSRRRSSQGQLAITHVEVVEGLSGASLIACRLETGRTHQIRIHLSESGHPIVGERVYIRRFEGPVIGAPRLMLHAAELGFVHPATEKLVDWKAPPPPDFEETLARLSARGTSGRSP
jgi:23S rRNA pseudouridine1911/1915/1917 synthase